MTDVFTLRVHLVSGTVVAFPVLGYEVVPPPVDEHGQVVGVADLRYTPFEGAGRALAFLDMRGVVAITADRGAPVAGVERTEAGNA